MIPYNQEQRLGHRSWHLLLYKKNAVALVVIFVALIVGLSKDLFAQGLTGYVKLLLPNTASLEQGISSVASFVAFIILMIGLIMFAYGYIVAKLYFNHFTFTLEDYGLKLKKGILSIKEVSIPYRQIQNVDVTRSPFYQFFGVSRMVIITAAEQDPKDGVEGDTVFDPIDSDMAEEIRSMLQKRIGVQVVEGEATATKEEAPTPVSTPVSGTNL